jgi:hypothetical protein
LTELEQGNNNENENSSDTENELGTPLNKLERATEDEPLTDDDDIPDLEKVDLSEIEKISDQTEEINDDFIDLSCLRKQSAPPKGKLPFYEIYLLLKRYSC